MVLRRLRRNRRSRVRGAAVSKEWSGDIRAFQPEQERPVPDPLQEQRAGVWPSYDHPRALAASPCCLPQRGRSASLPCSPEGRPPTGP